MSGAMRYEAPAITKTAFNCPTCQVLATQFWSACHSQGLKKGGLPEPFTWSPAMEQAVADIKDFREREETKALLSRRAANLPFIRQARQECFMVVDNLWVSKCFECDAIAIWARDKMIWPRAGSAPLANPDLPGDVRVDYDEASTILDSSPRGAAALLRLAIQKLCVHLEEPGKHLDTDIASLVKKGLDVKVQRALDIVRVVGNNAVHPGQLDLKDDRDTAERLFRLVNLIAEKMISEKRHIDEMYASLPQSALDAIEKRDGAQKGGNKST